MDRFNINRLTGLGPRASDQNITPIAATRRNLADSHTTPIPSNGPFTATVLVAYPAYHRFRPPTHPFQLSATDRSLPWLVARVEGLHEGVLDPDDYDPNTALTREARAYREFMRLEAIKAHYSCGVFLPVDDDPDYYLPQPGERIQVTYVNARTFTGGRYTATQRPGNSVPTQLPAITNIPDPCLAPPPPPPVTVPPSTPQSSQVPTPTPAPAPQTTAPCAQIDQRELDRVRPGTLWEPHPSIVTCALEIAEELDVRRMPYTEPTRYEDGRAVGGTVTGQMILDAYAGDEHSPSFAVMVANGSSERDAHDQAPCADFFGMEHTLNDARVHVRGRLDETHQLEGLEEIGYYTKRAFDDFDEDMVNSFTRSLRCKERNLTRSTLTIHATGRAIDIFIRSGTYAAGPDQAGATANINGDMVANWLVLNFAALGIEFLVWRGTNWNADRMLRGRGNGTEPRTYGSPHNDHIHVDISPQGGFRQTDWFSNKQRYVPVHDFLLPAGGRVPI